MSVDFEVVSVVGTEDSGGSTGGSTAGALRGRPLVGLLASGAFSLTYAGLISAQVLVSFLKDKSLLMPT